MSGLMPPGPWMTDGVHTSRAPTTKVTPVAPPVKPVLIIPGILGSSCSKIDLTAFAQALDQAALAPALGLGGIAVGLYYFVHSPTAEVLRNDETLVFDELTPATFTRLPSQLAGLGHVLKTIPYSHWTGWNPLQVPENSATGFVLPYDWRHSNALAAKALKALLPILRPRLWAPLRSVPFTVIAHSMGGIVSRLALEDKNIAIPASEIDTLITIGTPHRGAYDLLGMVLSLIDKDPLVPKIGPMARVLPAKAQTSLGLKWDSAIQLLPPEVVDLKRAIDANVVERNTSYLQPEGAPMPATVAHRVGSPAVHDTLSLGAAMPADEMRQRVDNLCTRREEPQNKHVLDIIQKCAGDYAPPQGVTYHIIAGAGTDRASSGVDDCYRATVFSTSTFDAVRIAATRDVTRNIWNEPAFTTWRFERGVERGPGDGTVPLYSALGMRPEGQGFQRFLLGTQHIVDNANDDHAKLPDNGEVWKYVGDLLAHQNEALRRR